MLRLLGTVRSLETVPLFDQFVRYASSHQWRCLCCRWFRQDHHQLHPVPETDDRIYKVGECLIIQHAEDDDAGRWVCVANNTAGVERVDVNLHVTSPLNVVIQPPGQLTIDVGAKAILRCLVTGAVTHPTAAQTWLKDGHVISQGAESLVIEKVQREDAGMYQCLARSEDDSAQSSVQLHLGGEFDSGTRLISIGPFVGKGETTTIIRLIRKCPRGLLYPVVAW